ncbi:MAG TPA: hypothetical protein VF040_21130 [Ktedonobacterales bacterium]
MRVTLLPARVDHLVAARARDATPETGQVVTITEPPRAMRARDTLDMDQARMVDPARVHRLWWYGLGILWIMDALLQAQPVMFTTSFVSNVLAPAAAGQPAWIAIPMMGGMQLWEQAPVLWNLGAIGVELLIGCLLLAGYSRPVWGRSGLILSVVWGVLVWYFGEGLGGLFVGSPTYLSGAPGSALLYVLLAGALLLPSSIWSSRHLLPVLRRAVGALWAVGALFQLASLYWSPLGLASVLQNVAMMPLPSVLAALDAQLVASMASSPALWNAALSAVMFGLSLAFLLGRGGRTLYTLALVWLVFLWVVFQGVGMIFSGMATDPNTPLLWALLFLPVLV